MYKVEEICSSIRSELDEVHANEYDLVLRDMTKSVR